MRIFRTIATLLGAAAVLVGALGGVPAAAKANETARLKVAFSPYRLGHSTTLKISLHLGVADAPEALPAPVTRFDMKIPPDMELIGTSLGLAICSPSALLASGEEGCSPNARLGYGSAEIEVPLGPEAVPEAAGIEAEMGPPVGDQVGVLLYAEAGAPVAAQLIFPGVLFEGAATSGQSLNTSVPLIPTLPGAPDISLMSLNLSLGPDRLTYYERVHGQTKAYRPQGIALPARCPRGGFRFVSDIGFQDGDTVRASSTIPCPHT